MNRENKMYPLITLTICFFVGFVVLKTILIPAWVGQRDFVDLIPGGDGEVSIELRRSLRIGGILIYINSVRAACIAASLCYFFFLAAIGFVCIKTGLIRPS
jgi:hypothetical protein